jgi:hypothetical protein
MKRNAIYLLIIFTYAGTAFVFSQNSNGNNGKSDKENSFVEAHIDKLKRDITLTAEQETEIRKLLGKLYKGREKAQKKDNPNKEKIAEKQTAQFTYKTELDNILTDKQKNILFEKAEQRKADIQEKLTVKKPEL